MAAPGARRITLSVDQSAYIDELVATGSYTSVSEVVKAGLEATQGRDERLEQWLRDDVGPTYDAMEANPARGLSAAEVRRAIIDRSTPR